MGGFRFAVLRGVVQGALGGADAALEALAEIKRSCLYREQHVSFDAYMRAEFGNGARHGQHLLNLYRVRTIVRAELPGLDATRISENSCRALTSASDNHIADIVKAAHDKTGKGKLTAVALTQARREVHPTPADREWLVAAPERARCDGPG